MNNTVYEGMKLRYDVFNDMFEAQLGQNMTIIDPVSNPIDTIYCNGYKFVRKFLQPDKSEVLSHVAVLYGKKGQALFKKFNVYLNPVTEPDGYSEAKPANFNASNPDYYLGKGETVLLIKGAKSFAAFFEVELRLVKEVVKTNQLRLQNEKDLITLFRELIH